MTTGTHKRQLRLITTEMTFDTFPQALLENMKALVITDVHFGRVAPFDVSFEQFKRRFTTVMELENPTVIFTLGDLFQARTQNSAAFMRTLFEFLATFGVDVYCLRGNHDRGLYRRVNFDGLDRIHVVSPIALCLEHPEPPAQTAPRLFLSHDLGNYLKLSDEAVLLWMDTLKTTFSYAIAPDDLLVLGHTHRHATSDTTKCTVIAPFSPDMQTYNYAVLTTDGGFNVRFETLA